MSKRFAILSSMILWDLIGFMLFFKGISLVEGLNVSSVRFILSVAALFGLIKARFVLKKRIRKLLERIQLYEDRVPFGQVYTKGTLILFASMMAIGMFFKHAPLPVAVRAGVDVAVGIALVSSWFFVICDREIPFGSLMRGKSALIK